MKILILTSSLPPSGGAEKVAWDLATKFSKNHDVHVITFGDKRCKANYDKITVHFIKNRKHNFWYYLIFGRKEVYKILNEINPDIINSHMYSIIAYLSRNWSCMKILTLHNSQYKHYNKTLMQKIKHKLFVLKTIRNFNIITTVSSHMKDYLERSLAIEVIHIPNGIDRNIFFNRNLGKEKMILYVGRLVDFKGVPILFKLAKKLKDYNFVFIGEGPLKDSITLDNVKFLGKKNSQEVGEFYNKSAYALFLSKYENFPLVGLEAMACGAIVITSSIPGFKEYVENGNNGFLINNLDLESLLDTFSKIDSRDDLDTIKLNAQETANQYSLDKIAENYINLFNANLIKN